MQITIDTDTDELGPVIRMLQAYAGGPDDLDVSVEPPKEYTLKNDAGEPIAKVTGSLKAVNEPIDISEEVYEEATDTMEVSPTPASLFAEVQPEPPKSPAPTASGTGGTDTTPETLTAHAPRAEVPVSGDLDVDGQPWDARIHSGTQTKVKDGTWKLKRGVDQALVEEVRAEHAPKSAPPASASPSPQPPPASFAGVDSFTPSEPTSVSPPPPPPPVPPVPQAAKALTCQDVLTFAIKGGAGPAELQAACVAAGLSSFPELQKNPDKVEEVARALGMPGYE